MTTTASASEGACGNALVGTKPRHSVVLRVLPSGKLFIIGGSSIEHQRPRVIVELRSPAAVALRLKARTFFYANNTTSVDPSKFTPYGVLCPPGTFHALLRLIGLKS
jgi:hypothetical protein